jgi:predicted permease
MNDLKAALRSLLSTPGATLVVIATLVLAIGATTAIFSVVQGVLLRPLGYPTEDRLVVVWATHEANRGDTFRLSPADYRDLRDDTDAFGGQVALYRAMGSTLTGLDEPVRVDSLSVNGRLFDLLGTTAATGRLLTTEDEVPGGPRRVVLTWPTWQRHFGGDRALVGEAIELDGEPYTVLGVTEEGFTFPPGNDDVAMYFPMPLSDQVMLDRSHRMFDVIAKLDDGVGSDAARAELDALADSLAEEYPTTNEGWGLLARPLREELLGNLTTMLWVLLGAVVLVLLIACANVSNVLIARSIGARCELAARAALGARPRDLMRRSLAESAMLGVAGTGGGILLAFGGVAWLRSVLPGDIPRGTRVEVDGVVLLFAVAISIGAMALFAALPALRSMAPDLTSLLESAGSAGRRGGGRLVRQVLVIAQVGLALVLLVGAGLMIRSFSRLSAVDPGFRPEGVAAVEIALPRSTHGRAEMRPFFEQLVERVEGLPGVHRAGAISDLPLSALGLGFEMELTVPGLDAATPTSRPNADLRLALPGYFEAMGMEIVAGRSFDSRDSTSDVPVAIVNQTLVERTFGGADPIGRAVRTQMLGELQVIGVVADIHHGGLMSKYESEIYLPYGKPIATNQMHVIVHSDLETATVAAGVGRVLAGLDSRLAPAKTVSLSDLVLGSMARTRFNMALLSTLAVCAALLAALGTYGIVAYGVSQRTGEIGVRMALGADGAATASMVVREALLVVGAGVIAGVLAALGATRLLRGLLFDVEPTDPLTYGLALAAAVLVGLTASWIPARRATRIDPVAALRPRSR